MTTDASQPRAGTRVVFVDHTAKLGGGEIALLNLVTHLDRSLVVPVVVLFEQGPLADRLRAADVETHVLPLTAAVLETRKGSLGAKTFLSVGKVTGALKHCWRLRALLRRLDAPIVHTNSLKADLIGGVAGRLAGKHVVWHIRDRISPDYLPRPVVRVMRALARCLPHHVIAISHATLATLVSTPANPRRWTVVHDGTLLPVASPSRREGVPIVGIIGRITPWKGQDIFVRAAHQLTDQGVDVRFKIIGSALFCEEAFERSLVALVDSLGLTDRVEFTGFRSNMAAEWATLDLVVHASTLPEPFGQVVIEGMAAGKPVIATRGGGVDEIIEDGVSGLLVPPSDVDALAAAIRRVLGDATFAESLARAGRRRVEDSFSIDRVARDVEQLYRARGWVKPISVCSNPLVSALSPEVAQHVGDLHSVN